VVTQDSNQSILRHCLKKLQQTSAIDSATSKEAIAKISDSVQSKFGVDALQEGLKTAGMLEKLGISLVKLGCNPLVV